MTGIRILEWDGGDAELELVAGLYAQTFAEPPYEEDVAESRAGITERIRRSRSTKPHFRLLLAWDDSVLTGFVLGTGIGPGDWWRDHAAELLTAEQQRTWLQDECFCVVELAVASDHRRGGVAGALLDAVVVALPYDTAVLSCYSTALPARRFYASAGWQELAVEVRMASSPALCILGRRRP